MLKRLIPPVLFAVPLLALISCQVTGTPAEKETAIVTVVETVIETVEVEKNPPYTYELLREMADIDNYIGSPASGHKIAFANINSVLAYPALVQESILEEWVSAGGSRDSIILLDNKAENEIALGNAYEVFGSGAEAFIQFHIDPNTNAVIGMKASEKGIYMIAVEVPVPGYPLMGIDNYGVASFAGEWAAGMIESLYGGWENIDRVVYLNSGNHNDRTSLRIYGSKVELVERFGEGADDEATGSKALMAADILSSSDAGKAIRDMLGQYPEDENIIVFCLNDSVAEGVYDAALDMDRWDPDRWLVVSQGLDDRGKELVKSGIVDADIAFFPEKYGKYLIPAILSSIYGNPVPPYIFMDNAVVTVDNIGEYYEYSI